MKKYCMSCGSPTEYSLKIPNYCSNCGLSFNKNQLNRQNIKTKLEKSIESIDFEDDDDFDEVDSSIVVPKINKLILDDDGDDLAQEKNKGVKIKDLLGTCSNLSNKKEKNKKSQKNISRKKILEDFASEAGSIRPKSK